MRSILDLIRVSGAQLRSALLAGHAGAETGRIELTGFYRNWRQVKVKKKHAEGKRNLTG